MDREFAARVLQEVESKGNDMIKIKDFMSKASVEEQDHFINGAANKYGITTGIKQEVTPKPEGGSVLDYPKQEVIPEKSNVWVSYVDPLLKSFTRGYTAGTGKYIGTALAAGAAQIGETLGMLPEDKNTFKNMLQIANEDEEYASKMSPIMDKAGELLGFMAPGGVFMKGAGWVGKGITTGRIAARTAKILGATLKARKVGKAVASMAKWGGATALYTGVEEAPERLKGEITPKQYAKDIVMEGAFGALFAGLADWGIKWSAEVGANIVKKIPEKITSFIGKVSPETIETYKKFSGEIKRVIAKGGKTLENLRNGYSLKNNGKLFNFVNKQNRVIEKELAGKSISSEHLISSLENEIARLEPIAITPRMKSAVNELKKTLDNIHNKYSSKEIIKTSKILDKYGNPLHTVRNIKEIKITGKNLTKLKRELSNSAKFDWEKTEKAPELANSYFELWKVAKDMENSLGGLPTKLANEKLSKLMDWERYLNIGRIKQAGEEYSGGATSPILEKYGSKISGRKSKSSLADEIRNSLKGIDDMVGTTMLDDALKMNTIYELVATVSPRLLPFGLGAIAGTALGYKQGDLTSTLVGAGGGFALPYMLASPRGRQTALRFASGVEKLGKIPGMIQRRIPYNLGKKTMIGLYKTKNENQ